MLTGCGNGQPEKHSHDQTNHCRLLFASILCAEPSTT